MAIWFIMMVLRISFTRLQVARDGGPDTAHQRAAGQTDQDHQRARQPVAQLQPDKGGQNSADYQLALGADVNYPAAKGDSHTQADQQQWDHLDHRVGQPVFVGEGAAEHGLVGRERVDILKDENDGSDR
jgi:hypothetical protein